MNEVFLIGKILEKIEFNFIYTGKNISKAKTKLELTNKSIIKIIGYNEIADYMYRRLNVDDIIITRGKLTQNKNIVIEMIDIKLL